MPQVQVVKQDGTKLVKKFKCNYCDRYFTRSEHRSRHELSHSSERPYRCTQCVSSFVRRDLLLRHCRTVHNGNIMPPPKKAKGEKKAEARRPSAADSLLSLAGGHGSSNGPGGNGPGGNGPGMAGPGGIGVPGQGVMPHGQDGMQPPLPPSGQHPDMNAAMLMTEMHFNSHNSPPSNGPSYDNLKWYPSPGNNNVPMPGQQPYLQSEQRGLVSLQNMQPPYPDMPIPSNLGPQQPLTNEDMRVIQKYMPSATFKTPEFHRVAPDIDTPVSVPQLGPNFDVAAFVNSIKQRPSIRTELGNPRDITKLQMNRYISAFFSFFHPIMPMFHIQTFDANTASPYLLHSLLAMGAVLCHDEAVAQLFSYNSRIVLKKDVLATQDQLEVAQTLIFIIIFASYTGDMAGTDTANARSILLRIVDTLLEERDLKSPGQKNKIGNQPWMNWVADQIVIRTYFCSLIAVTTMAAIFNSPGVLSFENIPSNMILPSSEVIWNNEFHSENEWATRFNQELSEVPPMTAGELLEITEHAEDYLQHPPILNPFSVRILGNVLFLRSVLITPGVNVEQITKLNNQISLWQAVATDPYPGMGQGAMLAMANLPLISLMKPMEAADDDVTFNQGQSILMAMQLRQHPIVIVSYTLLGVARMQIILDMGIIREALNYRSAERVAEAALTCLSSLQGQEDEILQRMTRLVVGSSDMIRATRLLGQRLYQAFLQSPLTGSIAGQCMILAYELVIAIVIWCHRIEERMRESQHESNVAPLPEPLTKVYYWLTEICREAGIQQVYGTLAPALAESIAEHYDAIKTWRLAEVMAMSLRLFARGLLNSHSEIMQARRSQYGYR